MTTELFDYQETGADFLAGRRRALLLDAPGLGKTIQGVRAADRAGADHIETVCPASVVTQWGKVHDAESETDCSFRARSYENARDKGVPGRPTVLMLDEIHYLGNTNAMRTARILGHEFYGVDGLISNATFVWGMSGTPAPRDPSRFYPILWAVIPGALLMPISKRTMDYRTFVETYCDYYVGEYGEWIIKGGKNLAQLQERIAPYVLRRTKGEVLADWKEPVCSELWLDPGEAAKLMLQAELTPEGRQLAEVFHKHGFEGLEQFARTEETGISRLRRYVGLLKVLPLVKWLLDQFTAGMNKIVVVCVHREVVHAFSEKLAQEGVKSTIYYGGMTNAQKDKAKRDFLSDDSVRVFLANITAAGTGLDGLQAATGRMLFAEFSWIADDNYQALCRLDRIGQQEPVLGEFAGLEGSLDGAIMAAARRRAAEKKALFN